MDALKILTETFDLVSCLAPGYLPGFHYNLNSPPFWTTLLNTEYCHNSSQLQCPFDLAFLILRQLSIIYTLSGHCFRFLFQTNLYGFHCAEKKKRKKERRKKIISI